MHCGRGLFASMKFALTTCAARLEQHRSIMTAKLEGLIKRELKLGDDTYTVSISPEGVKIAPKGKRKGREISWETLLSGDAELAQQLRMSVDAYGGTDDE
jgi:hypothetical protein